MAFWRRGCFLAWALVTVVKNEDGSLLLRTFSTPSTVRSSLFINAVNSQNKAETRNYPHYRDEEIGAQKSQRYSRTMQGWI